MYLSLDGGPEVGYKVEQVDTHMMAVTHLNEEGEPVGSSISSTVTVVVSPLIP